LRGVEVLQQHARLTDHAAGVDFLDGVHVAQVHDAAAAQRHGLPVIAGARAARGDRDVMGVAGAQDLDHLGLGFRRHDEIGLEVVEPAFRTGEYQKKSRLFARIVAGFSSISRWARAALAAAMFGWSSRLHQGVEVGVIGQRAVDGTPARSTMRSDCGRAKSSVQLRALQITRSAGAPGASDGARSRRPRRGW
jgi:hypothetical protein